ncbi:MAG: 5-deoxy-glucuronate isomerase [Spirochaetes bacterium]|nr:5-deoxy-glucuronate isomerase [Spirochaetota bacterium]
MSAAVRPGRKFDDGAAGDFVMREVFNQANSNLDFLSLSIVELSAGQSPCMAFPKEEGLIFLLEGQTEIDLDGKIYKMEKYDVLYVPVGAGLRIRHVSGAPAKLYNYRAVGETVYPVVHAKWSERKNDPARLRKLNKKNVYLMFDVVEQANKLVAGYTFYESETRAWPPHNHTDQEEVYSFIEGHGAMSVYVDDEHQTFVTSVDTGSHVTIPVLNYHPVFSQDDPLCFIWCIAGERYWVGDKNKDFMTAKVSKLTT